MLLERTQYLQQLLWQLSLDEVFGTCALNTDSLTDSVLLLDWTMLVVINV